MSVTDRQTHIPITNVLHDNKQNFSSEKSTVITFRLCAFVGFFTADSSCVGLALVESSDSFSQLTLN